MSLKELETYKKELEAALNILQESHRPGARHKAAIEFTTAFGRMLKRLHEGGL